MISISIPLFQCSDEMIIGSYLESLERFYPEIKNYASNSDQWEIILSLFNDPQDKQNAVQILGQVIVLLVHHISKINLDEMLCNWMKTMLFDERDYNLFNERSGIKLLVKHVGELWRALKDKKAENIYQ
ncbi:hypothetical protein RFI_30220 [Reticulomyxa filosa]|uniref:Uncharacterized protein n=1 Tax=Reticulomyxa filosa TaxID=46433 RepID=X6M172_RETFI|nr:hypothetical protein RFI_30220 [Reticulomyxa filosa]|eukprot:ETO07172.1 hypothetical protein RFI_30220 [Reticulomyxa filosa]